MTICCHASNSKCEDDVAAALATGGPPSLVRKEDKLQDFVSSDTLNGNVDTRVPSYQEVSKEHRVEKRTRPRSTMVVVGLGSGLSLLTLMLTLKKDGRFPGLGSRQKNEQQQASIIVINSYQDLLGIKCKTIDRPYYLLPEFDPTRDPSDPSHEPWMYSKCICDDAQGMVTEIDLRIPEHLWDNIGDAIDNPPLEMPTDKQFYCISRNVTGYEHWTM
jgi:hypothetical protein